VPKRRQGKSRKPVSWMPALALLGFGALFLAFFVHGQQTGAHEVYNATLGLTGLALFFSGMLMVVKR